MKKAPLCKCSCGNSVKWHNSLKRWNRYLVGHSFKGKSFSKIHKKRIAQSMTGKKHSDEVRRKISKNHVDISGEKNPFYGKKHSKRTIEKLSLLAKKQKRYVGKNNYFYDKRMFGKENSNWKGGLSFEPYSPEFNKKLKEEIKTRDDYMCQFCGIKENGRELPVHHIDYNKLNNNDFNLIILCDSHNTMANFNRKKWQFLFEVIQELRLMRT